MDYTGDTLLKVAERPPISTEIADEMFGGEAVYRINQHTLVLPIHRRMYETECNADLHAVLKTFPLKAHYYCKDSWTHVGIADPDMVIVLFPTPIIDANNQLVVGFVTETKDMYLVDLEDEDGNWEDAAAPPLRDEELPF